MKTLASIFGVLLLAISANPSFALARGVGTLTSYAGNGDLVQLDLTNDPGSLVVSSVISSNYNRMALPRGIYDDAGQHTLEYDYAGRLTSEAYTNGLLSGVVLTTHYHPVHGKDRVVVRTPSGVLITNQYAFDSYGRFGTVSDGGAYSTTYAYKPNSDLLQTLTSRNGANTVLATTRDWDYGYRTKSVVSVAGCCTVDAHSYGYDDLDRRTQLTLGDDSQWVYGYNDRNELISAKRQWSDSSYVAGQQFEYLYDAIGNRTNQLSGGDSTGANLRQSKYVANNVNEYSEVVTPGYKDIIGLATPNDSVTVNGTSASRKGDYFDGEITVTNSGGPVFQSVSVSSASGSVSGNVLVPGNDQPLVYDLDGNLSFDGVWIYAWDAQNRLVSMTMTNVSGVPNSERKKLDFVYDHENHRIAKTVSTWNGSDFANPATILFVNDGWRLITETDATSCNLIRSYLWGTDLSGELEGAAGVGGLLLFRNHSDLSAHFFGSDANGKITTLINASDSSVSAQYEYSPFGELIRASGPASTSNAYAWSTRYRDEESALMIYPARTYSGRIGRWLTKDPLQEKAGANLFAFVVNDPLNSIDPFGAVPGTLADTGTAISIGGALNLASVGVGLLGRVQAAVQVFDVIQEGMLAAADHQLSEDEMAYMIQGAGKALASALVGKYAGLALSKVGDNVVRSGYEKGVQALSNVLDAMRKDGSDPEEIARTVSGMRRALGAFAKSKTSWAMQEKIRQRNLTIYGDELGPTVDWFRAKGNSWEQIIEKSSRFGGSDLK